MVTRWYMYEFIRAVVLGALWSAVLYLMGQNLVWQSGIIVAIVWFIIASIHHMLKGRSSTVKAVLLALTGGVLFFIAWMAMVIYTGGDVANGLIIGSIVAALFGVGYYFFMYVLPKQTNKKR